MAIKKVALNAIHHFLLLCTITMMGSFHGADSNSITQGQELADWQNLVSANGIFKLGFFSPGVSKNRYLGIWYNNVPEITSVWVGNRDAPVMDSSGALRIDANGSLIITQGGEIRHRVFNSSQTVSNLTATLLDSGNFVLAESTTKRILWESFDYPSDSLLPGMKLGLKLKSDLKWSISPWTSDQVPAPGAFTLGVDPNRTTELYMWRRGEVYWTSGLWNNRSFNNVPQFTSNDKFVFRFVSNEEELYFTYTITDNSTISRWVINLWGQIHLYVWEGSSWNSIQNGLISPCEGNSTGCLEVKRNECRSGDEQFKKIKGDGFSGNIYLEDSTLSLNDCDFMCRRNCSCFAYALAYDNGTGCRFWGTGQSLSGDGGSTDIYTLSSNGVGSKKKWWIWFIVAVAVALPVLILGYFCHLCRKNLRHKGETEINQENMLLELGSSSTPSHGSRDVNMFEKDLKKGNELQLFSFASIVAATDDFSSENKLGEGGFGPVYKGKLRGGKEIAVKRLSKSSGQGQEEFKNEISLIAKLQHMNLVRLFGCCIQGKEKMLIYEYMPNKSLDSFIFDPDKRALLDWKKRFNIIEGIAQGLLYLHKYSRLKVIHRDLKASNILLDDEMNPKISDFGMARIFGQNESENTTRVVGTYGYMSPEYAMSGIFSVKSDVFSFGVLLLEILSGRRNTSFNHSNKHVNLIGYVWEFWEEGTVLEKMDPTLGDSCPKNKLLRWIHVGLLCVQESATDRPTMSTVVSLLSNEKLHLHAPNQPAFSALKRGANTKSSEGRSDSCSQNDVTMSIVEAR